MIQIAELALGYKIILFLLFIVIFLFLFWLIERQQLKYEAIFDISVGVLIGGGIGARILGMVMSNIKYSEKAWSLLPVARSHYVIHYFNTIPWVFFNIFDKQLSYIGFLFGVVVVLIILYHNSNKSRSIYTIYDSVFTVLIPSLIIFLVASIFGQFDLGTVQDALPIGILYLNEELMRYPIQLIQISVLLVIGIIFAGTYTKLKKDGLLTGIFLIISGLLEFILRYKSEYFNPKYFNQVDLYQMVSVIVFFFGLYIFFSALGINFFSSSNEKEILVKPRAIEGNVSRLDTTRKSSRKSITNFSQSFASRKSNIMQKLIKQDNE